MKMTQISTWIALLGAACLPVLADAADKGAPATPVKVVTDTYGDIKIDDSYRWLEDVKDPKVHEWSLAQDARTRKYFDRLHYRKGMYDYLMKQAAAASSAFSGLDVVGDKVFAHYNLPPNQQPMIAQLDNSADPAKAKIVVDPNKINPKGTTAIDWFVPSPKGDLIAVSMSDNGSEDGSLHLFDVASGKEVEKPIPRVQFPTGGGSLAWRADGAGFWYTRYPGPEEGEERQHFYQQLYFHKLGDEFTKDVLVLGQDLPKVAEIALDARQNPDYVIASVANGDGGEYAHYVLYADGRVKQVTHFEDKVVAAAIGPDNAMYLTSHEGAPRGKLIKLSLDDLDIKKARTIVPESEAVMQGGGEFGGSPIIITRNAIYLRELVGGPSRVAIYDHEGKPKGELPLPPVAAVDEVSALSDGSLLYAVRTYTKPAYFARYREADGKVETTALAQTSPVKFDDVEVIREFAVSKDGTRIPLNIIRRKGTRLDGNNPTLVYGYGGYGVNMTPGFVGAGMRMWLDAGGVYVVANVRGGGEFGEEWHKQGYLTQKQNVFDDFAAAAQYMIDHKYTSTKRLAIRGGSNGGLLMGAEFTQHPDMFRAVVSDVGIYDMLRVELDPNGLFNTTEFGTVKNPEQFKALLAYSPYHHVKDGTHYPAIFMQTGETDGRVNPMHSRKMIARLQAATASGYPVLLSINAHAGHGIGSALNIRVGQAADTYAFLFDQLGMKFQSK